MDEELGIEMKLGTGLLGAQAPASYGIAFLEGQRLLVIERRILRIEAALERAGIAFDDLEMR